MPTAPARPASVVFHDLVLAGGGTGLPWLEPLLGHFSAPSYARGPAIILPLELEATAQPLSPRCVERLAQVGRVALYRSERGLVASDGASWAEATWQPAVRGELALERREDGAAKEVAYTALLLALRSLGIYELHAAAVQAQGFAVLVVGNSGVGKTTLATALIEAGCGYLGDDRVLLRAPPSGQGAPELLSLPLPFRLTEETARAFPRLAPWLAVPRPKRELDLRGAFPGRHVARASGTCFVLFPRRASRTGLGPLTARDALIQLLDQSSSLVVPSHPAPERHLAALTALARSAVAMTLDLGPEWLQAPTAAARALLARLKSAQPLIGSSTA